MPDAAQATPPATPDTSALWSTVHQRLTGLHYLLEQTTDGYDLGHGPYNHLLWLRGCLARTITDLVAELGVPTS